MKMAMKLLFVSVLALYGIHETAAVKRGYAYDCGTIAHPPALCPKANRLTRGMDASILSSMIAGIKTALDGLKPIVSQTCYDAMQNFFCLLVPQCKDIKQPFYIDFKRAKTECQKLDGTCLLPGLCNAIHVSISETKKSFNWTCSVVQDVNGYCPDVRYKVAQFGANSSTSRNFDQLNKTLEQNKGTINQTCYDSVKKFGCFLARGPVCSADEKYFMSPFSREECEKKLKCLPVSYDQDGQKAFPHAACLMIPNKKAKRVSIPPNVPSM